MRDVAREMNLSETAFLHPEDDGYRLRWFTPAVEVDLCGHATVASAHVLWEDGHLPEGTQARFHTRSGLLLADRRGEWIELDFPAKVAATVEAPAGLLAALGVKAAIRCARTSSITWWKWRRKRTCAALHRISPLLKKVGARGIIVTARAPAPASISSRDSSRPAQASMRTRLPARHIPPWDLTGQSDWARRSSSLIRLPRAAAWSA